MQNLISGFTTREVVDLTKVNPNSLRYWLENKILEPQKIPVGKGTRNTYLYSFSQLVEVKAIMSLRKNVTVKAIRAVKNFIADHFETSNIADKQIIVLNNGDKTDVYLQGDNRFLTQITGCNEGQITHMDLIFIPSIKTHILDIVKTVKHGESKSVDLINFKARLKGSNLLKLVA